MTKYIDLIGKSPEEIDRELLKSHSKVLDFLKLYKEGNIDWKDFDSIQSSLMDATGYMDKKVSYSGIQVVVIFQGTIFPSNQLTGRGKNELEAICDACVNFVNNPKLYNTFSIKYLYPLKKKTQADSAR